MGGNQRLFLFGLDWSLPWCLLGDRSIHDRGIRQWCLPPARFGIVGVITIDALNHLCPEVCQLVDQAHVRSDPLTALLDFHVHRVEVWLVAFVEAIRNDQGGGATDPQLTVY